MQEILSQQRAKSAINPEELAAILYRGKERYKTIKDTMRQIAIHGGGINLRLQEMSRFDVYATMQKTAANIRLNTRLQLFDEDVPMEEMFVSTNWHNPGSIGLLMSTNVIKNMATDEQYKAWYPKIMNYEWAACYAQTELGTGSDVQNLKTLAVFDPKTQEFEFHTPSVDSIKWWPGDLGLASSHAVVFARLISNGTDHGVQSFFVQIRDTKTHIPFKGVEVGDIGPKMGYASKDNGYLRFTQFRASKNCLIGRYISIDSEGAVKKQGNPKRMYTAMMRTRCALLIMAYSATFKSVTIATRYSLFRTQFLDSNKAPIPIYNYQMQREKLFREMAKAYTMNLSTASLLEVVKQNNRLALKDDFSELQNTHILLCSFKSLFTYWQSDSASNLIRACGGHGYSGYSGLPHLLTEEFPNQILEGENSVLLLQVARHLSKTWFELQRDKPVQLSGFFGFLRDRDALLESPVPVSAEPSALAQLFRRATCFLSQQLAASMVQHMAQTPDPKQVWDTKVGNQCQRLARIFSVQAILEAAQQTLGTLGEGPVRAALSRLLQLAAINLVDEFAGPLLESGALTAAHLAVLLPRRDALLDELAVDGLVLAEGMQWDDDFLGSAIGSADKDPYETLLKWARELGQLNQFEHQIHPAVLEHQLKVAHIRANQKL